MLATLQVAAIGFVFAANIAGIGLAVLFDLIPFTRHLLMPAAITLRNVPYVALITVLMLAFGDSILSKTTIVAIAGFFPVLVNTMQGLRSADEVQLDRMRILNASWWQTFSHGCGCPMRNFPPSGRPRKSPAAAPSSWRSRRNG